MVDLQNDFCEGGALAVPGANNIIALVNQIQSKFDTIVATLDWHPLDHMSFAANHEQGEVGREISIDGYQQILWPVHCVQESVGAKLHPDLDVSKVKQFIHKGSDKRIDSYSAFYDNQHLRATGLADYLVENGINTLYFLGLATNFCVKYSCIDAFKLGFDTYVIADACKGIDLQAGDVERAYTEMQALGIKVISSHDI
jgi:nicotinamidase/pyrazinamidase